MSNLTVSALKMAYEEQNKKEVHVVTKIEDFDYCDVQELAHRKVSSSLPYAFDHFEATTLDGVTHFFGTFHKGMVHVLKDFMKAGGQRGKDAEALLRRRTTELDE